jgi:hypothetical protein
MRKRILIAISVLMICGLFAAAYAFNKTNKASASYCPMHNQSAMASTGEDKDSCCGSGDCCKDGKCSKGGDCCKDKDSCPMKHESTTDASKVSATGGDDCCQKGADCCKGGACCKHKS